MKSNHIIAMSAAIALAFAITQPADAQFGNILNKAKRAVKDKVERTADKATDDAKKKAAKDAASKAGEKTGLPVPEVSGGSGWKSEDEEFMERANSLASLHEKDYKPSKEAIAAFPDCQGDKVYKGCSRTVSQTYGAYEHLDPKYFPLQPYYKYPMMYGLGLGREGIFGTSMLSDFIRIRFSNGISTLTEMPPIVYDEKEYPDLITKTVLTHCALQKSADGQKYVMVVGSDSEKHPVK